MRCEHHWSDWENGAEGDRARRECSACGLIQRKLHGMRPCLWLHEWSEWSEAESMFGAATRERHCESCGVVESRTQGGAVDCRHEWGDKQRAPRRWISSDESEFRECSLCHLKVWRNKDGTWPERPRKGLGV
jgi:hypothetical protein